MEIKMGGKHCNGYQIVSGYERSETRVQMKRGSGLRKSLFMNTSSRYLVSKDIFFPRSLKL